MKTLQQEIVEELRHAQRTLNLLIINVGGYKSPPQYLNDLATKVESARCENCASRESDAGWCGLIWAQVAPKFACLYFEQKDGPND